MIGSGSQRKIGIVIRALLGQAEDLEIIGKNKIRSNDIPRQGKAERRYLTVREIDRLLLAARAMPEVSLMINVLLFTGLRPGEAKGLKVKDFDPLRGRLYIRRDVDDLGTQMKPRPGITEMYPLVVIFSLILKTLPRIRTPTTGCSLTK